MGMIVFESFGDAAAAERYKDWPLWRSAIGSLPFVVGDAELGYVFGNDDLTAVKVTIEVSLPSRGPVYAVREQETLWIVLSDQFPRECPSVIVARTDFPATPHAMRYCRGKLVQLCLTRQDTDDWWVGRTLRDVVARAKEWMDDAAAGLLVKEDEPHEPLFVSYAGATVEVSAELLCEATRKHRGLCLTTAEALDISGREAKRFVLGSGEMPAVVVYQAEPQSTVWMDCPDSLEELSTFVSDIGLRGERLKYWVNKRKAPETRLLVIVGTRRTKEVSGRQDADEWVAFELIRKRPSRNTIQTSRSDLDWTMTAHTIRESFSPELAARLSGWAEGEQRCKVTVIGAGALGSCVSESLARSGRVDLRIIDDDVLTPHNLARHILSEQDIGRYKAVALSDRFNALYRADCVAEGVTKSVQDLAVEEVRALLLESDFIVDCSASVAVQRWLADLPVDRPPAVCAYQVSSGRGAVMLIESHSRTVSRVTVDALEVALIADRKSHQIIEHWLEEEIEPVQIGGGCRSASARVPDTVCKLGGAWVADAILRWIDNDDWPEHSSYAIVETQSSIVPQLSTESALVEMSRLSGSPDWCVWVRRDVIEEIKSKAGRVETGGILVGEIDRQRRVAYVTAAWPAPPDSRSSPVGFTRGRSGLLPKLSLLAMETRGRLSYVGEWHTHPLGSLAAVSATDWATLVHMAELLAEDQLPALCLITNGCELISCVVQK